jgi:hypothetical protein
MENVDDFFATILDVPVDKLPILITYRKAIVMPEPKDKHMIKFHWDRFGPLAQFRGLGDFRSERVAASVLKSRAVLGWWTMREYVTEDFWVRYMGDDLLDISAGPRKPGGRLKMFVRGQHRIDDLTIRSIRPEDVPDISEYLRAVEKIPPEKRKGNVPMPDLKPGRQHKHVWIQFHPGTG